MPLADSAAEPEPSPTVYESADGRVWMLSTANTTIVVGVDDENLVTQRYWGPRLPPSALDEFATADRQRWNSSFQRTAEVDEQLPVDGGARWAVPSLQVVFRGAIRSLELHFEAPRVIVGEGSAELELTLVDRDYQLRVELRYRLEQGTDVIARWVTVTNNDSSDVRVLRADSANWLIPDQIDYRASSVHGSWGAESRLERRTLPIGEYTMTSRQGATGAESNPWIMIDDGTATEEYGVVRSVALAWSGSWRMTVQRKPEGSVSVSTGFGHEGVSWALTPGQALTTPQSLGLYSEGGFGGASRAWHRFVRSIVLPHGDEVRPILFNSWEATRFDLSESSQLELAPVAARLGIELFVIDDGWFGDRTHKAAGLGDWFPNPGRFPKGLHPIANTVRSLGMKFGIWVEPEMVNVDSDLYRAHPDWVMHWPLRRRDERRNQLVLNFGRTDVRRWALECLSDLIATYGLDYFKWDMNRPFTQAGWPENPHSEDLVWIEHTRGVYEIMDRLRTRHPNLRLEVCASGGSRFDLGILSRADQVWTSDNTDALDRQVIQHGFSQLYPAVIMGAWVTETVNSITGRVIPLDYRFHVAMAGNLGIGGDLISWNDAELEQSRGWIARYKEIRHTVQHGDQYRLGATPGRDFSAIEFVSDEQVVVLAYEPHRSLATTPRRIPLRGLQPDGIYRDERTGENSLGAVLAGRGILFNAEANLRGWNNTRFSTADYSSSLTVLRLASAATQPGTRPASRPGSRPTPPVPAPSAAKTRPVPLSSASLHVLSRLMPTPRYDRDTVTAGIVHVGVGGFHRSHQAMYLDRLLGLGKALEWGICGVGVLPSDRRMRDALKAQDHLYTLVLKHPDGSLEPQVIGSIVDYLFSPDDPEAVVERMASESTRIVSLTVTEGGYNVHAVTGAFDATDESVLRDLEPGGTPATVFGLVTEALVRRRGRGIAPFTVMSCDNIAGNGDLARKMFGAFAGLREKGLDAWVEREVAFPNSMVDRITPMTTDRDRAALTESFGLDDAWPVVCEPFTQWVLEDRFCNGRPSLEDAGVQVVDDVGPYELMKLRLLNASHQAMAYLGYLTGYRYAHEVCQDPLFTRFLLAYMDREATPTLSPVPGVDLSSYKRTLLERFANPEVRDSLARLCAEGSDRFPKFLLPVVRQQLRTGGEIERSALVVAAWARYAEGIDEQGEPIHVVDRLREPLMAAASHQAEDPTAFIANRALFGDLIDDARFVAAYSSSLRALQLRGARATLERLDEQH